ncbi:MAG: nucleotide exchange factor GrpE [Prevotella sp.]|nr:nucleotide exchange factor GrpE [Prevotella sp.]
MSKEKDINIEETTENPIQENNPENSDSPENTENSENTDEKDPLEAAQEENEKLRDQLLRTVAEFENYKKRTLKEKTELILNGGEKTITAVLPVLDDFERAIADKNEDAAAIKEGMELIFHKFKKTLEGLGVKKIETDDADFDVDYHEAIAMVPGMGDDKKGKIIDCVQTGYTLNDKVIRHAKVAVGQ